MRPTDAPGILPGVVVRLVGISLARHRVRAAATIMAVAVAAAAVTATSGRTEAARATLLAHLEDPAARMIRVTLPDSNELARAAVDRLGADGSVEWVIGLSAPGPLARNAALGDPRVGYTAAAVGTRQYRGSLLAGPLVTFERGRLPVPGEALAGRGAATVLGLADAVGTIADEDLGPVAVVGRLAADAPLQELDAYVLIRGDEDVATSELLVLARTSASVEPLVARIAGYLGPLEHPPAIQRAEELLAVRANLATEIGALDQGVLVASLAASVVIVGVILYGAVEQRRREFGIRRSQGATRSTIASLVVIESGGLVILGATVGVAVAAVVTAMTVGRFPSLEVTAAAGCLVALAGLAGSVPPAMAAAFQEPLYVLRSE